MRSPARLRGKHPWNFKLFIIHPKRKGRHLSEITLRTIKLINKYHSIQLELPSLLNPTSSSNTQLTSHPKFTWLEDNQDTKTTGRVRVYQLWPRSTSYSSWFIIACFPPAHCYIVPPDSTRLNVDESAEAWYKSFNFILNKADRSKNNTYIRKSTILGGSFVLTRQWSHSTINADMAYSIPLWRPENLNRADW